jgi:hypothetical protein
MTNSKVENRLGVFICNILAGIYIISHLCWFLNG